jgi:hypothetical protein
MSKFILGWAYQSMGRICQRQNSSQKDGELSARVRLFICPYMPATHLYSRHFRVTSYTETTS